MTDCIHADASGRVEGRDFVIKCNTCGAELHRSKA